MDTRPIPLVVKNTLDKRPGVVTYTEGKCNTICMDFDGYLVEFRVYWSLNREDVRGLFQDAGYIKVHDVDTYCFFATPEYIESLPKLKFEAQD